MQQKLSRKQRNEESQSKISFILICTELFWITKNASDSTIGLSISSFERIQTFEVSDFVGSSRYLVKSCLKNCTASSTRSICWFDNKKHCIFKTLFYSF